MKLTKNLTLQECIKSDTAIQKGIDNTPPEDVIPIIKSWAENIFQPIRDHFKAAIGVNSMYRCPELNKLVGGAKGSQHEKGEAGDIDADIYGGIINRQIYNFIKDHLEFDQMIIYNDMNNPDFVHVSYRLGSNRKEILYKDKNRYQKLHNKD